jgi:CheY-like chemotaxis protein
MQNKKRILIVDDLPTNLTLFKTMLELEGFQVTTALGCEQALSSLRQNEVDVIFLDVIMPGTSGLELCKRVKRDAELQDIPLIILTGLLDEQTRMDSFSAGADAFLTKPATFQQLNDVIEGALDRTKRTAIERKPQPMTEWAG